MKQMLAMFVAALTWGAYADLVGPTHISRLQRIGYEVLPEMAVQSECEGTAVNLTSCDQVTYFAGFAIVLVGILLFWVLVKPLHARTAWGKVRLIWQRKWWRLLISVIVLIGCVSALRMAVFCDELSVLVWACLFSATVALSCIVRAIVSRVYRERMGWTYVIVSVLCYAMLALVWCFQVGRIVLDMFNVAGGRGVVYDDGPGWKYPESVSENERMTLNAQIDSVRVDLQKALDASDRWVYEDYYHLWHHKKRTIQLAQMEGLLKDERQLALRCKGIPIEWLVDAVVWDVRQVDERYRYDWEKLKWEVLTNRADETGVRFSEKKWNRDEASH